MTPKQLEAIYGVAMGVTPHPDLQYPRLVYWGHYVAHDNNRDAMGMTLNLRAAGTQSPSLSHSPNPGKLARSTKSSCATTPA